MQAERSIKRPILPSNSTKKIDSLQQKLQKIQKYYRYRLPSIYRQLKNPIYDNLLKNNKTQLNKNKTYQIPDKDTKNSKGMNLQNKIQHLYKKVMLNSKYHHRQKMRFNRTPLMKYIKYNFSQLQQKLKSKVYLTIYDDLEDDDEDDETKQDKKQYEVDPHFSTEALARYKKKNSITGNIVSAHGYDDIKDRLISEHGWVQNPDTTSLMYDYKHMSKKKDIDYVNLLDEQVVNHFHQNKSITAKFGLTRNIRNICSLNKDPSQFFPRCYDVNDVSELQNFYQNFKLTYVQAVLKRFVQNRAIFYCQQSDIASLQKIIQKCIQIIERQSMSIQKKISKIQKQQQIFITEQQWQFILLNEKITDRKKQLKKKQNENLLTKAQSAIKLAQKGDPQWNLNRDNIWIVKPASLSRGRGIKTFNQINQIFDYIIGKEISWVVQKYIQNPLIIKKRKFDIRQWVLLTDFKPFRVWIYDHCYIRFCATQYQPENLKDRKVHLTNNSVTKGVSDIKNDGIQENMLSQKQFSLLLQEKEGKDIFKELIKPQMRKIAVQSLESVKENMIPRKNTFQIFGFDFMIDQNYKVWLIQVNSSPTMEYSTKVTTDIVQKGMSDLADLINNYIFKGKYFNKAKQRQLYGDWVLLTNP